MAVAAAVHAARRNERRQRQSKRQAFSGDHRLIADFAGPWFIHHAPGHDPLKKETSSISCGNRTATRSSGVTPSISTSARERCGERPSPTYAPGDAENGRAYAGSFIPSGDAEAAKSKDTGGKLMSLEAWSTAASLGTFVVIAATAIAALVQLRHTRSSNQIAAVTQMLETLESERFRQARRFVVEQVPKLLEDPAERTKLGEEIFPPEIDAVRYVANFFEAMGALVKAGTVNQNLVCDLWDGLVFKWWKQLEPIIMIRREVSDRGLWCSFEYLAVICEKSLAKNQGVRFPRGMRRMTIDPRSLQAAAAFAKPRDDASQS